MKLTKNITPQRAAGISGRSLFVLIEGILCGLVFSIGSDSVTKLAKKIKERGSYMGLLVMIRFRVE